MPEVLEVELTRRAAVTLVGRRFVTIERTDPLVVAEAVESVLPGCIVRDVRRRGKVLAVDTDGPVLGLHFGMTGRLLRDGTDPAIDRLAYGAASDDRRWDRWVVRLDDGSHLRIHDPRRLGRVWLDPRLDALGPDALGLTPVQLAGALHRRRAPLKSVLLDQSAIAGLGNLLTDEVLWWAALDAAARRGVALGRRDHPAPASDPAAPVRDAAPGREPHRHAVTATASGGRAVSA